MTTKRHEAACQYSGQLFSRFSASLHDCCCELPEAAPPSDHFTNEEVKALAAVAKILLARSGNYARLQGHTLVLDGSIDLDTESMQALRSRLPSKHWD